MNKKFDIVKKESLYKGFYEMFRYSVKHNLFNGGESDIYTREILERGHAVAVFLYDPKADEVVLIEQFRAGAAHSSNPWMVELVAGMIDDGETPENVARREAVEEAGAHLTELKLIADYYNSAGGTTETTKVYYAELDAQNIGGIHGLDYENEDIRVFKLSSDEFLKKLDALEYNSGSLVVAGLWFKSHLATHSKTT